jgi:hypothetical protein
MNILGSENIALMEHEGILFFYKKFLLHHRVLSKGWIILIQSKVLFFMAERESFHHTYNHRQTFQLIGFDGVYNQD